MCDQVGPLYDQNGTFVWCIAYLSPIKCSWVSWLGAKMPNKHNDTWNSPLTSLWISWCPAFNFRNLEITEVLWFRVKYWSRTWSIGGDTYLLISLWAPPPIVRSGQQQHSEGSWGQRDTLCNANLHNTETFLYINVNKRTLLHTRQTHWGVRGRSFLLQTVNTAMSKQAMVH